MRSRDAIWFETAGMGRTKRRVPAPTTFHTTIRNWFVTITSIAGTIRMKLDVVCFVSFYILSN